MMAIALRMAKRGLGRTAPNPSVGAVIVQEARSELVARGWTRPGGRPHAETEAIGRAGAQARGATLYVTLEPCAHHGKTPPCVDAIIAAGLKRVVVGVRDPDPRTAGAGIARLRSAGIEVIENVLSEEARLIALGHILRVTCRRPFVQVKIALRDEGTVPRGWAGTPVFVTGAEARARGHLMRAEADAILVGRQTVADDDPLLTCRLPGLAARSPIRVVVTASGEGIDGSRLARTAGEVPFWILAGPDARASQLQRLEEAGARIFAMPAVAGRLSVPAMLEALADEGVTRLLVEGGPQVWKSFALAGHVDEAVVFHAPAHDCLLASYGDSVQHAAAHYLSPLKLRIVDSRHIGEDTMWVLRP
jgi:diaminohydroxyphosphoribosylaminopyrimidine deaminase/5-amino-6-(5-phosphoribosylamino)uracil reductase